MSQTERGRGRKPGRRTPHRDRKPIILIVCEGKKTEPEYFQGLLLDCKNATVAIRIAKKHGVPATLVDEAKTLMTQGQYSSVWCVFDVDNHPNLAYAKQKARDNGIDLAISNPCFELWLLIHFTDPSGSHDRKEITRRLKVHLPGYDKGVEYETLKPGHANAVKRARRLDKQALKCGTPDCNPTTGVYRLVEAIRQN